MKTYFSATLALTTLLLISCEKKVEPPVIPPQERPISAPTPTPTPQATPLPQATPEARLCPDGTLYVVKHFSVRTQDGLHGFPVGKQVKVVNNSGIDVVVTDGTIETTHARDYFTNDLDKVDSLRATIKRTVQASQSQTAVTQTAKANNDAILHQERERSVIQNQIRRNEEAKKSAETQISALKAEIESLKPKYGTYNPSTGWNLRKAYYSSPTKQRNEMLISQLESQQRAIDTTLQQLRKQLSEIK